MEIPEFTDAEHRLLAQMISFCADKVEEQNGAIGDNTKFRLQAQAILAVVSALALVWGAMALALLFEKV